MSFQNPISTITDAIGPLQSPNIGSTILGNIPSIPLISTRNYFLQQLESWISSPSNATQWLILFDDFPKTLKQATLQELEYTTGNKSGFNVPNTQLTNYFLQKSIGCVFAQGCQIPKESVQTIYPDSKRGFIGGAITNNRSVKENLTLNFMETNLSFVDGLLRPWVILAAHKGMVARPKDESIKTNMMIMQYSKTNQYLSQIPRKIWTFFDVAPVGMPSVSYDYANSSVEIRSGIEFAFSRYQVYNTTYIPIFSLIDKFSNGGIKELTDTILIDQSIKNLGNLF